MSSTLTFVLHSRKYRDSSLILEALTRGEGRFGLVVNGVRRKRAYVPQPFVPLLVDMLGSGDLRTAGTIEPAGPAFPLRGRGLMTAMYLNELLYRVLGRLEAQPRVFDGYASLLAELCELDFDEWQLRSFELMLLETLGYGLDLVRDSGGKEVLADVSYRFVPAEGFRRARVDEADTIPGSVLLALDRAEGSPETRPHARQITRRALRFVLGGREIRARELFGAGNG